MSPTHSKEEALCLYCVFWDHRPEDGVDDHHAFCRAKEMIVSCFRKECPFFQEATEENIAELNKILYGDPEMEEGDADDFEFE